MHALPSSDDLWPSMLGESELAPPIRILRAQAEALEKRTNGVLSGRISSHSQRGLIFHSFYIVAPSLNNYEYRLFRVEHPVTLYPITISAGTVGTTAASEQEFVIALKQVLSSSRTLAVVQALISQSNEPDTFISDEDDDDLPF